MAPGPLLAASAVAAVVAMGLATAADMRWMLFNSDILLPADFVHRLLTDPGAALDSFQLPRVPSLVPDLLVYTLLSLVLPGWRLPALAYAGVSAAALTLLCGAMTAGLSGRGFGRSVSVFGAVAVLALLADLQFDHAWGAYDLILFPVIHSGSLLCTFAGLFLVRWLLRRPGPGRVAALALLCAAAALSDRLFLLTFVVPALAGSLAVGSRLPHWRGFALVLACVACGSLAGTGLDRVLFNAHALLRQPDLPVDPAVMFTRLPALRQPRRGSASWPRQWCATTCSASTRSRIGTRRPCPASWTSGRGAMCTPGSPATGWPGRWPLPASGRCRWCRCWATGGRTSGATT